MYYSSPGKFIFNFDYLFKTSSLESRAGVFENKNKVLQLIFTRSKRKKAIFLYNKTPYS